MASRDTQASKALKRAKAAFELHVYELDAKEGTYGESVAATLGISPTRLFKTLVAEVDGNPVVAIVPTAGQLSLKALARAAKGKKAKMADPKDAERWTGYVTGGISPLGQKRRLPTFVDGSIGAHATLFVSGGRRGLQIELAPEVLIDVAEAEVVDGLGES